MRSATDNFIINLQFLNSVMVNSLDTHHPTFASVMRVYEWTTGKWWGCNWQTEYGPRKLNLQDVRASQARLMADATPGDESQAWEQATRYLAEVEADAKRAEMAASNAISFAKNGQWQNAIDSIEVAVKLETKYRHSITWTPLHDEIKAVWQHNR